MPSTPTSPFSFNRLDNWLQFHEFRWGPPPTDRDRLFAWIHATHVPGHFEPQIDAHLDRLLRHHVGGNEQWLAITGPAHVGKTRAVTHVLMQRALREPTRWRNRLPNGALWTPYVYVEAGSNQEARGLLAEIARVTGLPTTGTETELRTMLTAALPELGVQAICADEAHMFRRRSDNASRLADGLRSAVHLPVPIVFVGVDLETSALLYRSTRNSDTSDQLNRRHHMLTLAPISRRDRRLAAHLIGGFKQRMASVADLDLSPALNDSDVLSFAAAACGGRPGSLLHLLKTAAIEALALNDGVLSAEILAAEADNIRHARAASA